MELKQIKELLALMEKSGVKKLFIKEKSGFEIEIEKKDEQPHIQMPSAHSYPFYAGSPLHHKEERPASHVQPAAKEQMEGKHVLAPMVGTFYGSSSPGDPLFVKVGDRVDENSVVCIIEAMKVMNEVKAGVSGTVAEVLVENAHPVEFGTKLFRIV